MVSSPCAAALSFVSAKFLVGALQVGCFRIDLSVLRRFAELRQVEDFNSLIKDAALSRVEDFVLLDYGQSPDSVCVFFDRAVCGKETRFGYVDK